MGHAAAYILVDQVALALWSRHVIHAVSDVLARVPALRATVELRVGARDEYENNAQSCLLVDSQKK